MSAVKVESKIGRQSLSIESGKLAKQADGAVLVRYGDTVVLVASVSGVNKMPGDFFPLRVDYREMTYAAGKFPGGFWKREGRPTQKEILTGRLMDRPVRPLFPESYIDEVVITGTVLAADLVNDPDILSMIGASASLVLSKKIPFLGPTGSVRVSKVDGQFIVFPTHEERDRATLNLVVSGTEHAITMLEGAALECSEDDILQAILSAQGPIREICRIQKELAEKMGVVKSAYPAAPENPLLPQLEAKYFDRIMVAHQVRGKFARYQALEEVLEVIISENVKEGGPTEHEIKALFGKLESKACRMLIMSGKREDGRGMTDLREIACEVGVLPRVHGSALFTRGETQALVTCTLGSSADEQRMDGLLDEYTKKFMLDYNFPPFSVGEAKAPRAPSRREIGHGNLAESSIRPMLPAVEQFPYTIRIVSEILESNGSSSQASVCGGTLALMDAGVPIKRPIAGLAMGLVQEGGRIQILTDINGAEDHYGDMDLKIAGTEAGVTGVQMDLKVEGVKEDTLMEAFLQARAGRLHILKCMAAAIDKPRAQISEHAPRLLLVKIPVDKIGAVIGPSGRVIKKIQEETGATIDIADDGSVNISCKEAAGAERARDIIVGLTSEPEVGKTYLGKVSGIKEFGAFVEIMPGRDGLCHISEIADGYVEKVEDVVKLGDEIMVKILSVDDQGKIRLSRKAVLREQRGEAPEPVQSGDQRPPREDRGDRRGRGDRGHRGHRGDR